MSHTFRHWLEWYPWRVIAGLCGAYAVLYLVSAGLMQVAHRMIWALVVSYGSTILFVFFALAAIIAVCRLRLSAASEAKLAGLFLLGAIVSSLDIWALVAKAFHADKAFIKAILSVGGGLPLILTSEMLGGICVILVGAFLGRLAGRLIKEANLLLVVTVVAAAIDFWGVYWGPVSLFTTTTNPLGAAATKAFSAAVPGASTALAMDIKMPVMLLSIGIGDFLFLAMFFSILRRLKMNQVATFWTTLAIMIVAPLFFLLDKIIHFKIASNLPGLPFIALGTIICNWRHFRFTQEEKRALIVGACIVAALIAAIIIIRKLL